MVPFLVFPGTWHSSHPPLMHQEARRPIPRKEGHRHFVHDAGWVGQGDVRFV